MYKKQQFHFILIFNVFYFKNTSNIRMLILKLCYIVSFEKFFSVKFSFISFI